MDWVESVALRPTVTRNADAALPIPYKKQHGPSRCHRSEHSNPHPLTLRADGHCEWVGAGGLPIGLIDGAAYDSTQLQLAPGDRMLICSDGLIECPNPQGQTLDEGGLIDLVRQCAHLRGPRFFTALEAALARFAGTAVFPDDVSAVLVGVHGPRA